MIRSLSLSSDNYNLLGVLLALSKYRYEGSGNQLASYLGHTLSITCVKLVIHFIVWLMIFVFVMSAWWNHTLIRMMILSFSRTIKSLLVPTRCTSITRSTFNYWIPRLLSFICDRTDFIHQISVLHQHRFLSSQSKLTSTAVRGIWLLGQS